MIVHSLTAFNDNYIWLIEQPQHTWVIDPGDAKPVLQWLAQHQRQLSGILITHHHADHIGGVNSLLEHHPAAQVYAPSSLQKVPVTHPIKDGDIITLSDSSFRVIATPGHTLDHLCFVGQDALFCGDTLFTGGCGRVFEGTADQMAHSLATIKTLPAHLKVYCGHEYSLANLNFAIRVESNNPILQQRHYKVNKAYKSQHPLAVTALQLELDTNPFLRTDSPDVATIIEQRLQKPIKTVTIGQKFACLREWKDELDATGVLEQTI
ncbi:hydroxyacylglutathione hydrolase [Thiomicrospira cyclica]|uniref:Hydroxyacylglutathione hydrolase n=1 Tax=Thiomicrospira cyclica (strain DSM 14477 / JCM 11371 / ALM1) TaxID=717773 RepID=F6DC73_THICA|nr:hydroxyacylglutathione hydrolase [Thiomicrospira cyclica]AEG31459.1 Hydroxyacylglutathione hydrolase [Thiomicrospira cyclica ALM1]